MPWNMRTVVTRTGVGACIVAVLGLGGHFATEADHGVRARIPEPPVDPGYIPRPYGPKPSIDSVDPADLAGKAKDALCLLWSDGDALPSPPPGDSFIEYYAASAPPGLEAQYREAAREVWQKMDNERDSLGAQAFDAMCNS